MSLKAALDKLKNDSRMVDINIKSGVITPEEIKKMQEKLPDLEGQAQPFDVESLTSERSIN